MTVRVGVIGAGTIGQDHIRRISHNLANARVSGVADVDRARAESVASAVDASVFESGQALIAAPTVDAVLVATWGPSHEEYVVAALAAGKPVFCEKPLAPTVDACLRIVDAEITRGKRLVQVGFMRRFDPGYRAMKDILDKRTIGTPLMVHCAHRGPSAPPNFTSDMLITDSAIHELDLMRWLLDEETVAVRVLRPRSSAARADLVSPQVVVLETESGVLVDVEVFVNAEYGYDIRCEVVGEHGTVSLGDAGNVVVKHAGSSSGHVPAHWIERFRDAYDAEMQAWIDSVLGGSAIGPGSWDGYVATAVAEACLRALDSGERVTVPRRARPDFYAIA